MIAVDMLLALLLVVGFAHGSFPTTNHETLRIRGLVNFDWSIDLEEGYPVIQLDNNDSENRDMEFKYNFTGTLGPSTDNNNYAKYLSFALLDYSCDPARGVMDADVMQLSETTNQSLSRILGPSDATVPEEVDLYLDIDKTKIAESPYYQDGPDELSGIIQFCLRADYMYDPDANENTSDESIDFHEVQVTVNVDLTAGFNLTAVSIVRNGADEASAYLACRVRAYFCTPEDQQEIPAPYYSQGDVMSFCVDIAQDDKDYFRIDDILETDLDQDNEVGVYRGPKDAYDDIITNFTADTFTVKNCESGMCHVMTQLKSKYFVDRTPNPLTIFGTVICALGGSAGQPSEAVSAQADETTYSVPSEQPSFVPTQPPSVIPTQQASGVPTLSVTESPTDFAGCDVYPVCPEGFVLEDRTNLCCLGEVCEPAATCQIAGMVMNRDACCVEATCDSYNVYPDSSQCITDSEIGMFCFDCSCGFCDARHGSNAEFGIDPKISCCEPNPNGVNCKPNSAATSDECSMGKGMFPSFLSSNGQVCSGVEKDMFMDRQNSCGCKPTDNLPCAYSKEETGDPCLVCNTQQLMAEANGAPGVCYDCYTCLKNLPTHGASVQSCLDNANALEDSREALASARECYTNLSRSAHTAFEQCNDVCFRAEIV
mmetsp:Transcript_4048/g.8125  ORF Transcript_4048/g.8125 Transcript_4048/m.8125 type:complete len:655 (+) Transcript_4048:191-2155(+)|eukprot:scaffold978_cov164-Amphora_coffeaeformis.AAC.14